MTRDFRYVMGTSVQIEAHGLDEGARRAAIDEAFASFAEVDRLMSNYRDDSELTRVNRNAASGPVPVSDPLWSVLAAAERVSHMSNGGFDVTIAPAVRLWGFYDRKPHVPTDAELAAVRPLIDYRLVVLDPERHTVRFVRQGVELDLGGIGKGFAVEIAAGVLRGRGLQGFIDAGGNQYLLGTPPGKPTWTIGIKDPDAKDALLGALELPECSVSTSANYFNTVTVDGRKYGHLLDPRTLRPSSAALSVTIVSRDGTLADAMSKAVFMLGPHAGLSLADSIPGMSALIAYRKTDGSVGIIMSDALKPRFHPVARS